LTTLRSPRREMGACAADILIEQIEADTQPDIQQVSFEPQLVVRASTRPLSSADAA